MLKKLALIVALGISSLQASDTPKVGLIKRIKNSSVTAKFVGGIIPCLATIISMEIIGRTYKGIPDKKTIVTVAHYVKCIALAVGLVFYDWIVKFHVKKQLRHLKKQNKINKANAISTDPALIST